MAGLIEKKKEPETYGFLSIAGDPTSGLVGGCLLLNRRGRPLEFHCTAPVRPNRAQVILYGPTLRPYVVGEQIAAALIAKTKATPAVLWTDDIDALTVRDVIRFPIGYLEDCPTGEVGPNGTPSLDVGHGLTARVHEDHAEDIERISQRWDADDGWIDLREPFERIREAIAEALKAAA